MQHTDETAHNEFDELLLTETASARGMKLLFGSIDKPMKWRFDHFIDDIRAQWSVKKASVQFLGYNETRGFSLFAFSDDEETMDFVVDEMQEMARLVIRDMGATLYYFCVTGDLPGHPEVLMVGGATIGGEHAMGWLEIKRDSFGNEHLGTWSSFTAEEEKDLAFASSWMMRLLETRPHLH